MKKSEQRRAENDEERDDFLLALVDTPERREALADRVTTQLRRALGDRFDLTVVDVALHPEIYQEEKLLILPALIRRGPQRRCVVVGNLEDGQSLRETLGLPSEKGENVRSHS